MKLYSAHIAEVCFVFKNSNYAYIPPYMHKTLPTLGNEKEQWEMKFFEKLFSELIFFWATKNLKMFYFICLTRQVLKKITPLLNMKQYMKNTP